jgi:large subunit ribosomal protein L22
MKVSATLYNLRTAPRKSKLVADLIKGMDVQVALDQLDSTVKKTSLPLKKLLQSAITNGENNFGLDKNNLYVLDVIVMSGPMLKRWMPKAFGRAGEILKRTSVLKIVLEEREEGKGRKSKEQMEKERKKRMEEKKKEEQEKEGEIKEEEKVEKVKAVPEAKVREEKGPKAGKKWGEKIFRRKSM